jgi:hypothetical protein
MAYYMLIDQVCIDICTPDAGTDGATDACRVDNTLDLNTVITQGEPNGVWEFNAKSKECYLVLM